MFGKFFVYADPHDEPEVLDTQEASFARVRELQSLGCPEAFYVECRPNEAGREQCEWLEDMSRSQKVLG